MSLAKLEKCRSTRPIFFTAGWHLFIGFIYRFFRVCLPSNADYYTIRFVPTETLESMAWFHNHWGILIRFHHWHNSFYTFDLFVCLFQLQLIDVQMAIGQREREHLGTHRTVTFGNLDFANNRMDGIQRRELDMWTLQHPNNMRAVSTYFKPLEVW